MNPNMQGHNHGGKGHLLGMLGIGAIVLVVLLGTGRSFQEALPFALFLACPLMMVAMMIMMRRGHEPPHGSDTTDHRNAPETHQHDARMEWQDTPATTSDRSPKTTDRP